MLPIFRRDNTNPWWKQSHWLHQNSLRALKSGLLRGIYIPKKEVLDDRNVMRLRITLKRQLSGYKSRVKHLLYNNGVIYPECFQNSKSHWSKRYLKWVHEDVQLLSESRNSLDLLLRQVELFRKSLLEITRLVRTYPVTGVMGKHTRTSSPFPVLVWLQACAFWQR